MNYIEKRKEKKNQQTWNERERESCHEIDEIMNIYCYFCSDE